MEDDLNVLVRYKTTSVFRQMEDNLNFIFNEDDLDLFFYEDNLNFLLNDRRSQL